MKMQTGLFSSRGNISVPNAVKLFDKTGWVFCFRLSANNPGVLEDLFSRVSLEGVDDQGPGYEFLGWVGDIIPIWGVELEES